MTGRGEVTGRWLAAATALDDWMRAHDYAGHDPHDLLASPLVEALTFGSRWMAVGWTQLGKRIRWRIRAPLGVPCVRNAKAIGLVLAAHVRLARVTGDLRHRDAARALADWLWANGSSAYAGTGWGYPFPLANRDFRAPAETPSSVATAYVGHALLDAAAAFGWEDATELAARGGEFVLRGLNRIPGAADTYCFSYTPVDRRAVHNANLLAASLLARLGRSLGDETLSAEALHAARFSARAQRPDGSWPYGPSARNSWVDSFHTGYSLIALAEIRAATGADELDAVIDAGIDYWRRAFLIGPAVGFYAGAPYPIDLHAVAHAIVMLLTLRDRIADAVPTAERLAAWSLDEMRDPAGYFYYQRHRHGRDRRVFMRWTQAWMLRALAALAAGVGAEREVAAVPAGEPEVRTAVLPEDWTADGPEGRLEGRREDETRRSAGLAGAASGRRRPRAESARRPGRTGAKSTDAGSRSAT